MQKITAAIPIQRSLRHILNNDLRTPSWNVIKWGTKNTYLTLYPSFQLLTLSTFMIHDFFFQYTLLFFRFKKYYYVFITENQIKTLKSWDFPGGSVVPGWFRASALSSQVQSLAKKLGSQMPQCTALSPQINCNLTMQR